jgi:hypothetical protein
MTYSIVVETPIIFKQKFIVEFDKLPDQDTIKALVERDSRLWTACHVFEERTGEVKVEVTQTDHIVILQKYSGTELRLQRDKYFEEIEQKRKLWLTENRNTATHFDFI